MQTRLKGSVFLLFFKIEIVIYFNIKWCYESKVLTLFPQFYDAWFMDLYTFGAYFKPT